MTTSLRVLPCPQGEELRHFAAPDAALCLPQGCERDQQMESDPNWLALQSPFCKMFIPNESPLSVKLPVFNKTFTYSPPSVKLPFKNCSPQTQE